MSTLDAMHTLYKELLSAEETLHYDGRHNRRGNVGSDARRVLGLDDALGSALGLLSRYYRQYGELPSDEGEITRVMPTKQRDMLGREEGDS